MWGSGGQGPLIDMEENGCVNLWTLATRGVQKKLRPEQRTCWHVANFDPAIEFNDNIGFALFCVPASAQLSEGHVKMKR